MFTGIIQRVGEVRAVEARGEDLVLRVDGGDIARQVGDSIAVNGVCLTVLDDGPLLSFDVSVETLARTLVGTFRVGDPVNLEPSLTLSTPLGGHLVSGHVDGTARIDHIADSERSQVYRFRAARSFAPLIAAKGSIALDGISLTVNEVVDHDDAVVFTVNIVPHTLAHTNLHARGVGDRVHLEVDTVARYLLRMRQTLDTNGVE